MMEYVKYHGVQHCNKFNKDFAVLEYQDKENDADYIECSCCGKPIKKRMIVLQDIETDVEEYYLGFTCAKKLVKIS